MIVIMILATDTAGCIGIDNQIPWSLKDDMKFFRETTTGYPVIMGRKTAESLGNKPLPKRENWVLTHNIGARAYFETLGFNVEYDLNEVLAVLQAAGHEKVFIIGGAQIYDYAIEHDLVDEIYHTWVDVTIKGGDTFIKKYFDLKKFKREEIAKFKADERNGFSFTIHKLTRNK